MPPLPTLLCLGDSHTAGLVGTDWVGRLRMQVAGKLRVVRAGIGGQWAVQIGRRLGPLLDRHPDPAGITLLAGTNDVLAASSFMMRIYYRATFFFGLHGQVATYESYVSEMDKMLATLAARAPRCRVAVITLPPVGEDLTDQINARVARYNAALKGLVSEKYAKTAQIVDLNAACAAYLEARPERPAPPKYALRSFFGMLRYPTAAPLMHFGLGVGWDTIARMNGMMLMADQVHLNDTAGGLVVEALAPFVAEVLASRK